MKDLLFGVRLAATGRAGWLRSILAAFGVGVALLTMLGACAASEVASAEVTRLAARTPTAFSGKAPPASHLFMFRQDKDLWQGQLITRMLIDVSGTSPVVVGRPPGLLALPGPGECAVSPALRRLFDMPDAGLLRQRYCDGQSVVIGAAGLLDPGELVAWVGTPDLAGRLNVGRYLGFGSDRVAETLAAQSQTSINLTMTAATALLLIPFAVLIVSCVQISSRQRHRRIAALRLCGASRRQATAVLAGEVLLVCLLGDGIGWLLFGALMPLAARTHPAGVYFVAADARPGAIGFLATLLLPIFGVWVARHAAARAIASPYVERRSVDRPAPRLRSLVPVAAGLLMLTGLLLYPKEPRDRSQDNLLVLLLYIGLVLCLAGVPLALPASIRIVTGWVASRTRRLSLQLAATRLQRGQGDLPRAAAALALAMVTLAAAQLLLSLFDSAAGGPSPHDLATPAGRGVVIDHPTARSVAADYNAIPHVRGTLAVHNYYAVGDGAELSFRSALVADCADLELVGGQQFLACTPGRPYRLTHPYFEPRFRAGERIELAYETNLPTSSAAPRIVPRLSVTAPSAVLTIPLLPGVAGTDGDLFLPPGTFVPPVAAQPAPNALVVFPDGVDQDATEAAIRSTALAADPAATFDSESQTTESLSSELAPYRTTTVGLAGAVGLLLLTILTITGYDAAQGRRRITAGLVVVGADIATLRRTQLWYLALPLAAAGLAAIVIDGLVNSSLDHIMGRSPSLHAESIVVMCLVAVAGFLATAPSAWVVTGRRPEPELLRAE